MRVLVVTEYYPRESDPTLGIWAHEQTRASAAAGAEVQVLVLHRPVPPLSALRSLGTAAGRATAATGWREAVAQPRRTRIDGITVRYLRYGSPPRPWSYARWGAWAAPWLRAALPRIRTAFPFDLIHAHYAVPAGDAVRRAAPRTPMVVSVHGGDVHGGHAGAPTVSATLAGARLVLANSAGTERRSRALGARRTRVVHLGTDLPAAPASPPPADRPRLVTVGNLIDRKRQADVIEAVARLAPRHPGLRYDIVGDGPDRAALQALAAERGIADHVRFHGRLEHSRAVAIAREATAFVLPSIDEAFGVAYVEAMAAGVPAIGCRGEDGPEEIAACGGGIELVAPRDPGRLAERIDGLLTDPGRRDALGTRARDTVAAQFTWTACGRETVAAYAEALT
jgi:teichuronic acid biosynthesis glycosyltransferase TuaC